VRQIQTPNIGSLLNLILDKTQQQQQQNKKKVNIKTLAGPGD